MDEIGEIKIPPPNKTNVKRILYWTPMFQAVDFNLGLGGAPDRKI
jgi:hypothetical protein